MKIYGRSRIASVRVVLILIGLVCPLALGQDNPIGGEKWELSVTPCFWMAGIEGDVTARGNKADIDVGFDEIWDALDFAGQAMSVSQSETGKTPVSWVC